LCLFRAITIDDCRGFVICLPNTQLVILRRPQDAEGSQRDAQAPNPAAVKIAPNPSTINRLPAISHALEETFPPPHSYLMVEIA
jgi:hypothetical protein